MEHIHSKEIKAWADGAKIQSKACGDNRWVDVKGSPQWIDNSKYRTKPEKDDIDDDHTIDLIRCDLYCDAADILADHISRITGVYIGPITTTNNRWLRAGQAANNFPEKRWVGLNEKDIYDERDRQFWLNTVFANNKKETLDDKIIIKEFIFAIELLLRRKNTNYGIKND
jgi:hypothetical protein